ncbi:MAG: hypothetical protein RI906_1742 [Pseudomonadota bacterium]|jgi:NAD(P)-dependent dehydrogenase (short-subunit alcohol dehydrogenase family)
MTTPSIRPQRLLITGGASGIGLAVARQAIADGASVSLLDINAAQLTQAQSSLGARCISVVCDVTDRQNVDDAVRHSAAALGGLDAVVNSAGIDQVAALNAIDDLAWSRLIDINLSGAMRVCRAALPWLEQSGAGAIVNLASGAGLVPLMHRSAYCASKAGLIMFGKSLALELADCGIRVNTVCPGAVDTPLFRTSYEQSADPAAALAAIRSRYAQKRVAEPDEIAAAVLFLCSPAASYITGTALAVDGGRTFH